MCDKPDELISIAIIEDHHIFREALCGYLKTKPDKFSIVGDVATSQEGLELVQKYVPDIVLLDLGLPERTDDGVEEGLAVIQNIRLLSPATQVVILTGFRRMNIVFKAIQAGAVAYMLKDHVTGQELIENLLRVVAGDPPIDPEIARKLWAFFQKPIPANEEVYEILTTRELEVLELISHRKSNKEIAETLVISHRTVQKHVSNILSKLQLQNRVELMMYYRNRRTPFS